MTRVIVPTQLRGYTGGKSEVDANGRTLNDVLVDHAKPKPRELPIEIAKRLVDGVPRGLDLARPGRVAAQLAGHDDAHCYATSPDVTE